VNPTHPIRIVWGYRWWLLGFAVAAAVVVFVLRSEAAEEYRATAVMQVVSGRQSSGEFVDQTELLQLTNLYAELGRSQEVQDEAAAELDADAEDPTLPVGVDVTARDSLQLLDVTATSGDPQEAADVANAYAAAFATHITAEQSAQSTAALERIQARIDELESEVAAAGDDPAANTELVALQTQAAVIQARPNNGLEVLQDASVPGAPSSPKPARDAVLAFIAALVIGSAAAYARATLTDRFGSAEEAATELGVPLLAAVPRASADDRGSIEAYRILRTNLSYALRGRSGPVVEVTSTGPGAGKTHTAVNMSKAFCAEGRKVILVDCDFRRPALHTRLGVPVSPGMADLVSRAPGSIPGLAEDRLPLWSLPVTGGVNLDVIPAGSGLVDPAAALTTERAARVFASLPVHYDLAVVDSPPVLAVVDPLVLAHYADAIVFVVDARRDRRSDVRRAVDQLRAVNAPVIGFVYNSANTEARRYGYDDERGAHEADPALGSA
jgi:capsular exopolysaccharide synthesis family protein